MMSIEPKLSCTTSDCHTTVSMLSHSIKGNRFLFLVKFDVNRNPFICVSAIYFQRLMFNYKQKKNIYDLF